MGASSSKTAVKNVNNQLVVNKTDIDVLNKSSNTAVANTVINNASKSTASIIQQQGIRISGLHSKGDINISGVSQKQEAVLTFKNVNINDTTNDASNAMLSTMLNDMTSKIDNESLTKMMATADSNTKVGALSMPGWASSSATTTNTSDTTINNEIATKLKNIVANSITNNFSQNNISDCIASVTNSQDIQIANITSTDGSINLTGFSQDQSASLMSECISKNGVANKIVNDLASTFGVKIVDDTSTKTSTDLSGTSTAATETQGLLDSVGNMISSIFGSLYMGIASIVGVSSLSFLCCCFCCVLLFVLMSMGKSSQE